MESVPQWEVKELIRVMSFNIWESGLTAAPEYAEQTRQRADLNVRVLKRYNPDLIGFQEFDPGHLATYQSQLEGYATYHSHPLSGLLSNAIFWKPDRFDLLRSGVLPLSLLPEPADAAWVHLRCLRSGHELLLLNTQLNDESEPARVESTRLLLDGLAQLQPAQPLPVILTGDFNCNAWSPIY